MRGRTIESPRHQLLNNQENNNGGDVVLDRHYLLLALGRVKESCCLTDIEAVLEVKECPETVSM